MDSRELARGILMKYSSVEHDETHCRMSDLEKDIARILDSYRKERDNAIEMHEAWLRMQRNVENDKSWLQRLFA